MPANDKDATTKPCDRTPIMVTGPSLQRLPSAPNGKRLHILRTRSANQHSDMKNNDSVTDIITESNVESEPLLPQLHKRPAIPA